MLAVGRHHPCELLPCLDLADLTSFLVLNPTVPQLVIDKAGFLFAVHRLTSHDALRFGDNLFYIERARDVLDLLRGAFGCIYLVFDGFLVDKDDEQSKRQHKLARDYAKLTSMLQTDATSLECRENLPIHIGACFRTALRNYAAKYPDQVVLDFAEDEGDAATARLALEKEREVPGSTVPVLSGDSDMSFFKDCTPAFLSAVELDDPCGRELTLSLVSWRDRCQLLLGPDIDPSSTAALHYMSTLAVVLGNDRVPAATFRDQRPGHMGRRLTTDDIFFWLQARRREVEEPPRLLSALIRRLPAAARATREVIERAARWYWADEVQLPELEMLGDNRDAILQRHRRGEISMSLLEMVTDGRYGTKNLLQPLQAAGGGYWVSQPPLVRLEQVFCHLVVAISEWLYAMGWVAAADAFNTVRVTAQTKTVRGMFEARLPPVPMLRRLDHVEDLLRLTLPQAALALFRSLGSVRIPELQDANYQAALCQLVALAEKPPTAGGPVCSCVAPSEAPAQVPGALLSLFDTWACCLQLLFELSSISPFAGGEPSEEAVCILFDPLALLHLASPGFVKCAEHTSSPPLQINALPLVGRAIFDWVQDGEHSGGRADNNSNWREQPKEPALQD